MLFASLRLLNTSQLVTVVLQLAMAVALVGPIWDNIGWDRYLF